MRLTFEEAIAKIKKNKNAADYLTPKRRGGKEYSCPFCGSSDAASEIPQAPGKWKCFSCGASFDVLDVMAVDIDPNYKPHAGGGDAWKDAFKAACDDLGIEVERGDDRALFRDDLIEPPKTSSLSPTGKQETPPAEAKALPPLQELCTPEHWQELHAAALKCDYLTKERGIPAEVIARHPGEIGYSESARPPVNKNARVKAVIFRPSRYTYMERYTDPEQIKRFTYGKKKCVNGAKDSEGNRRDELTPQIWNTKALDGGRPVFIVEGIIDALSIEAAGAEAVALQGVAFIDKFMAELDARRAAGKEIPPLLEALDNDRDREDSKNPGRDAAARLRQKAEARGVFVAEGASIVGDCKDANDALVKDAAAFRERVTAAEAAARKAADERKAEPPAESFPDLPKGARGLINPDALQTTELIFVCESNKAAAALQQAGAQAIGTPSAAAIEEAFRILDKRKKGRADLPLAIVDCLGGDEQGRALARDIMKPRAELLEIPVMKARPVFAGGADAIHTAEDVAELVRKTKADFDAAEEEERREYYSKSAACMAISFWDETAGNKPFSSTGFEKLDEITDGGFYPGLYIVGAISSLGKTTFVLQVADYVAKAGRDVLYFSLEMSGQEILAKSFSRITHEIAEEQHRAELARPVRDILTGSRRDVLDDEQSGAIIEAIGRYSSGGAEHLHITEAVGTYSAEDIRRDVLRHRRLTGNWPLVVIDYLQILKAEDPHQTDKQATDAAVLTLKQMSRDFDIPVFCISSFNRDNYLSPINMAAFKESGAVEYSADVLLGLQYYGMDLQKNEGEKNDKKRKARLDKLRAARESDSKEGKPVFVQLRILKNRNGAKSDCIFKYFPRYNHYEPCEWSEAGAWMREAMTRDDLAFDFLDTINADGSITPEESREKADIALAKSMDKIESIAARRKGNGRYSDRL